MRHLKTFLAFSKLQRILHVIPRMQRPVDCSVVANTRAPPTMFTDVAYKYGVTRVQSLQNGIIGRVKPA